MGRLLLLGLCAHAGAWRAAGQAAAAAPSRWTTRTLLDTTVRGRSGTCHLLLVQPPNAATPCLHIDLVGRGTRPLAAAAVAELDDAFARMDGGCCACIVRMASSRGSTLASLPVIAKFLGAHRRRLAPIVVLEARGLALNAVRIVRSLSKAERIKLYHSLDAFAAACERGSEAERAALQLTLREARRATAPRGAWARLAALRGGAALPPPRRDSALLASSAGPAPAGPRTLTIACGLGWLYGLGVCVGPFYGVGVGLTFPGGVLAGAGGGVGVVLGIGMGSGAVWGAGRGDVQGFGISPPMQPPFAGGLHGLPRPKELPTLRELARRAVGGAEALRRDAAREWSAALAKRAAFVHAGQQPPAVRRAPQRAHAPARTRRTARAE